MFSHIIATSLLLNYNIVTERDICLTCDAMPILPSFRVPIASLYPSPNFPKILLSGTYNNNPRTKLVKGNNVNYYELFTSAITDENGPSLLHIYT